MNEMTSSTATSNRQAQSRHQQGARKTLTDFSIESLIGAARGQQEPAREPHRQPSQSARQRRRQQQPLEPAKKFRPKNFQCPACKMAFSNNGQLRNHLRIHTGERPFTCNYLDCNKTFTRNEELTRHKLIHTGVRPHICPACAKRFGRKDHLKKHVRTHERKRQRKRSLVAQASAAPSSFIGRLDMFSPPKPASLSAPAADQCDASCLTPSAHFPAAEMIALRPPPAFSTPVTTHHQHNMSSLLQASEGATSNDLTFQRLASDYWQRWYNLIGIYRNPAQPAIDQLSDLLRR